MSAPKERQNSAAKRVKFSDRGNRIIPKEKRGPGFEKAQDFLQICAAHLRQCEALLRDNTTVVPVEKLWWLSIRCAVTKDRDQIYRKIEANQRS
jgi:hypothetical protein